MGVYRMWKEEQSYECYPPEAVHATFGPAKELRSGSPRGSVSDRWLSIQCSSEGEGRVETALPLWRVVDRTCMVTFGHPCRVKSFRKAESAVMDDLGNVLAKKIIDITILLNS